MTYYRKIKVLISAYACEPNKGSEPGVGWNWAKQIAKFAETHVITRANNREVIEEEMKKSPISNLYFHYYDLPKWMGFWKKKERGLYLYYFLWQIGAYRLAKNLHRREKFDLLHHITFGNLWLPTFMPLLPIPFIWGPIGGGEQVSRIFRKAYSLMARAQEFLRDLILASLKVNLFFMLACKKAKAIIVRTQESFKKIPSTYMPKTFTMIETGVDFLDSTVMSNRDNKDFLQVISIGRFIHLKGFDLAIRAFAQAFNGDDNIRMTIIGEGPDRVRLQKICQENNISQKVHFTGYLSHEETMRHMSKSSIFLFPSLKEGGAWVLYEAMLAGLPIVCLDIAGPSVIVTDECGIKVKPINPEQTIRELADAILKLANDPELRKKMGEAGRKRVMEHYTWDKKGEFIKQVYERVLGDG